MSPLDRARRLWIPEVIQSAALDCGPAALGAVLRGFGVPIDHDRLRAMCRTTVDGSSIDVIEDVAVELGLEAEQVILPADHVLLAAARSLPAIAVVLNPGGETHFVVLWRRVGDWVQVMDPATGRRWVRCASLRRALYVHEMELPESAWQEWSRTGDFLGPLRARLASIGRDSRWVTSLVDAAADAEGDDLARLDAAARFVGALIDSRAVRPGGEAQHVVTGLQATDAEGVDRRSVIPAPYWSVRAGEDGNVHVRGAVLVRVRGRRIGAEPPRDSAVAAARVAADARPVRDAIRTLFTRREAEAAAVAASALVGVTMAVVFEAMLFRALVYVVPETSLAVQRVGAIASVAFVSLLVLGLHGIGASGVLSIGRRVEIRMRRLLFRKLARLDDRYFTTRLSADLTERAHQLVKLRQLPEAAAEVLRGAVGVLVVGAGLVWLDPGAIWSVLIVIVVLIGAPVAANVFLSERDLRFRTHAGALGRFTLDVLLGLAPVRSHAAEATIRASHDVYVGEWTRAGFGAVRLALILQATVSLATILVLVWLFLGFASRHPAPAPELLLFVYWGLELPLRAQAIVAAVTRVPELRSAAVRALEPIGAAEEHEPEVTETGSTGMGVDLVLENVSVVSGGHQSLAPTSLHVSAGEKLAVVGPSGSGKSTLIRVFLGLTPNATGRVLVDGADGIGARIALRRRVAWIDPDVRLWRETVAANVVFGHREATERDLVRALSDASLDDLVSRLSLGVRTELSENGRSISGGEAQRVRHARAFAKRDVRLVLLDEAARGLDRDLRARFLDVVGRKWPGATVIFVTHQLDDVEGFDRTIELAWPDGSPAELREAHARVNERLWASGHWRELRMIGGTVHDSEATP